MSRPNSLTDSATARKSKAPPVDAPKHVVAQSIIVGLPDEQVEQIAVRVAELMLQSEPGHSALLDRRGLARALNCCPDTLDALRKEPNFPEVRLLDAPRFELAAVLVWLRERGGDR